MSTILYTMMTLNIYICLETESTGRSNSDESYMYGSLMTDDNYVSVRNDGISYKLQ